jgi:uncharacterized protein (DUF486 family)
MKLFEKNVGNLDRMIRVVAGLVFAGVGFLYLAEPLNYIAYFVALIMFVTAATKSCALYSVAGLSTMEKKAPKK